MSYEILILIGTFIITLGAQFYLNQSYKKCQKISSSKNMTGEEVARQILDANGLRTVKVVETSGVLSDHYDPRTKVVRLSSSIFGKKSMASVAVAAHECGHAIQDKDGYFFLRLRSSIIPIVNFASMAGYIAIMIGLFLGALGFLWIGILLEVVILLFQLITLPVEFNASHRGLIQLKSLDLLDKKEMKYGKRMLTAAALTYVASVATSFLEILRLVLIARRRER